MYKVFLVDDEEILLNHIVDSVPWMDNGFEVVGTETNPQKAVDKIRDLKPHVVFSDLRMPSLDGHGFIKVLREKGCDAEFVMLSAYGTFEDAKTFFKQEGFDYLLKPLDQDEVQLVLEKLAIKLSRKYPQASDDLEEAEDSEELSNATFLKMIDYIKEHYKEKLTLEKLGKKFGLSTSYICRLFSKHYNTTLTCFITDIRMEKSMEMLKSKDTAMKEIALECGYKDYFYFSKVFKEHFGISPSQVREG